MRQFRVLIVSEGTVNFWVQFAIGFHAAGCQVSFVSLHDGLIDRIRADDTPFDLVVINQQALYSFAIAIRDNPAIAWGRWFKHFLMVQFHDIGRELPTMTQAPLILGKHDINISYLIYCSKSREFLEKTGIYDNYIFSDLPVSFDSRLKYPEDAPVPYIDDIGDDIVPRNPPPPADGVLAFHPRLLYIGSYFFNGALGLQPDGPFKTVAAFRHAMAAYQQRGRPAERFGFIDALYEQGDINAADFFNNRAAEYLYNYCCLTILPVRLDYVRFVKEKYGHDFHLYGEEWKDFGLDCVVVHRAADDAKYRSAFISVDFGSTYLDTSLYQRTAQILGGGGRLLQLRQPDSAAVYGELADQVCFDSPAQLAEKIDDAFAAPRQFLARQAALTDHIRRRHDPERLCRTILQQLGYADFAP